MKDETYSNISQDITLAVGEKTKIKSGFLNTVTLVYSGMISKDIFSVSVLFGSGNQGFSYNLYYSKDAKSIKVGNVTFFIVNVSADQLTFRK